MRIRDTKSAFSTFSLWICLEIILINLTTGAVTEAIEIQVLLGGSASFEFNVTKESTITLVEWNRCPDYKVFVFSPDSGLSVKDRNYEGRLSAETSQRIVLKNVQESDLGNYCYKLTTFPQGSLQREIRVVKKTPNNDGLPLLMLLSVGCGAGALLLWGISIGVICCKRRRCFPENSALDNGAHCKNPKKTKSTCLTQTEDDNIDYLNVP